MLEDVSGRKPFRLPITDEMLAAARNSVTALKEAVEDARRQAGSGAFTLAWLSDMHLLADRTYPNLSPVYAETVDTSTNFRLALQEMRELDGLVDLIVFGGDLADSGCGGEAPADEYREFGRILDDCLPPTMPSLPLLGNHDHADALLSADWHQAFATIARPDWPESVDVDDFYYETRRNGWRLIALDTRQNTPIAERQRIWLAATLEADSTTPTILLLHRPIVSVGNWVDDYRLHDHRTIELLHAHACIKVVLGGHTHMTAAWAYLGRKHVVFPSIAYGIPDPVGWGVVILDDRQLISVFVKDLAVPDYHDNTVLQMRQAPPAFRQLQFDDFARDKLFNPCQLPR